jgi:hypothetical protein
MAVASKGIERRQFGRRETFIHGMLYVPSRPPVACVVRNVSERGALLEVHLKWTLPYRVRLVVEAKRLDIYCAVRHHGTHGIGVEFIGEAPVNLLDDQQRGDMSNLVAAPELAARKHVRSSGRELRDSVFGLCERDRVQIEPVRLINGDTGRIIRGS